MRLICWRQLLLSAVLEFAALAGAPLRPQDIEQALKPRKEIAGEQLTAGRKRDLPVKDETG